MHIKCAGVSNEAFGLMGLEDGTLSVTSNPSLSEKQLVLLRASVTAYLCPAWGLSHPVITVCFRDSTGTETPRSKAKGTRDARRRIRSVHCFTIIVDKCLD